MRYTEQSSIPASVQSFVQPSVPTFTQEQLRFLERAFPDDTLDATDPAFTTMLTVRHGHREVFELIKSIIDKLRS